MRVIIAGSRSINPEESMKLINQAVQDCGWEIDEVISGECKDGIDAAAKEWAKQNNKDFVGMPATWGKYNKAAGYKRNQKMGWYAKIVERLFELQEKECPERYLGGLIAIRKNKSSGTSHMIDIAEELGLRVFVLDI